MSKPRYRYAHQQERKRIALIVEAGEALCMQTDPHVPSSAPGTGCVMKTRWIAPGSKWHVVHDDTGTITLGAGHERCNTRDAAIRGNKARGKTQQQPTTRRAPTANRWTL